MVDTSYVDNLWEKYSKPLQILEPSLPEFFIGLGRLEADLIRRFDSVNFEDLTSEKNKIVIYGSPEFIDFLTLSQLWVMGVYEVVRTLCQKAREKSLFDEETKRRLDCAKNSFERIRVPLAKLEPCYKNKEGYSYPLAYFSKGEGIVWFVSKDEKYSIFTLRHVLFYALDKVYSCWEKNLLDKE